MPGPSTWPLLSHVARSQPGGVRRFLCSPQPPQQPPLSGWGSPSARELQAGVCLHRPGQAPTPFQCPRRGGRARADHPGVGTCPNPAVTWGSNTWPRRGSLWLLQSPSSLCHPVATAHPPPEKQTLWRCAAGPVPRRHHQLAPNCPLHQWGWHCWQHALPAPVAALDLAKPGACSHGGGFLKLSWLGSCWKSCA